MGRWLWNSEVFYEGQQTQRMSRRERFQPSAVDPSKHKGVMKVWDGNNVPGITRQRTRFESLDIVGKISDGHFHKFVREGAQGLDSGCLWSSVMTEYAVDLGFAPVPDDASEEVEPFATSRTRWSEVVMGTVSRRWYLTRMTWVASNNTHPRFVETLRRWGKGKGWFRLRSGQ